MLEQGLAAIHPIIIGELACGHLKARTTVLELLRALPTVTTAGDDETLYFIERHKLMGRGIGHIDVQLLASTAIHGTARLWSRNKRLFSIATELGLAYTQAPH